VVSLVLAVLAIGQSQTFNIGSVDIFGQTGLDEKKIRAVITIHAGQKLSLDQLTKSRSTTLANLKKLLGKPATDVNLVSYDIHGKWMIFIGVQGPTVKPPATYAPPAGTEKLIGVGLTLYKSLMDRIGQVTGDGAREDDSKGYALNVDPQMNAIQVRMRAYALSHEENITQVAQNSGSVDQRQAATMLLGYAKRSREQLSNLVQLVADPDETVRNNAMRALVVIAHSDKNVSKMFDPTPIVDLLSSGGWTDRNKSTWLLEALTQGRNPELLALIKKEALPSLFEVAHWTNPPHAASARYILGRVAGIEESRLNQLVQKGDVKAILDALKSLG